MKTYELIYIITPEISAEEAEAFTGEIEGFIKEKEGAVLKSERPSAKTLSYRIKKQASGFFGLMELQMGEKSVKGLADKLQKDSKVLRHMITVKEAVKEKKERRIRKPLYTTMEAQPEAKAAAEVLPPAEEKKEEEKKIELGDIDKKLDEILGE